MARTSLLSPTSPNTISPPNTSFTSSPDYITLSRLIPRLQASILPSSLPKPSSQSQYNALEYDPPSAIPFHIKSSPYHRTRLLTNVEHARTQLLRLEQSAQGIKIQSQKRDVQNQIGEWRNVLRALRAEVEEWARVYGDAAWYQQDGGVVEDSNRTIAANDTEEKEDLLAKYGRNKRLRSSDDSQSSNADAPETLSRSTTQSPNSTSAKEALSPSSPHSPSSSSQPQQQQTLRLRRRRPPKDDPSTPSSPSQTPTAQSTSSSTLLQPSSQSNPTPTTAQAISTSSSTQANLTESLAQLATQLKLSTQSFSNALTVDTSLLNRASESLEKNVTGMAAAGKRMGVLRRYSEGKGWWGRMVLYLWIFGLWLALVVIVGVGPKLRF